MVHLTFSYSRLYEYPTHAVLQSSGLSRNVGTLENGLFRLPSSSDFLSPGSFRLDLRIHRTSALLFYLFRIRHFRIRYIWYIKFLSGILVESYGTWLLFQRLDDASKDSDIPKNVPFAFAINNRNTTQPRGALLRAS